MQIAVRPQFATAQRLLTACIAWATIHWVPTNNGSRSRNAKSAPKEAAMWHAPAQRSNKERSVRLLKPSNRAPLQGEAMRPSLRPNGSSPLGSSDPLLQLEFLVLPVSLATSANSLLCVLVGSVRMRLVASSVAFANCASMAADANAG